MSNVGLWWLAAGAVVAVELFTGTVYLLMLAVGLACAALAAMAGAGFTTQVLVAAAVSAVTMSAVRAWKRRAAAGAPAPSANPDLNLDIGSTVQVDGWNADGTTTVHHRGAVWSARLAAGAAPGSGAYVIRAIEGSRLVLAR